MGIFDKRICVVCGRDHGADNACCPKCGRYNALLSATASNGLMILKCRDCGYSEETESRDLWKSVDKCCAEGHFCRVCPALKVDAVVHAVNGVTGPFGAAHRPRPLTLKDARAILSPLCITLRKRDGEYRVNYKDAGEAPAYYTDDLLDAVETGITMRGQSDAYYQHLENFEDTQICNECGRLSGGHAASCGRLLENKEN